MSFLTESELPAGYCLSEKGNVSVVARESYLEQLRGLGIEEPSGLLKERENTKFFTGRKQLISIPLTGNSAKFRIVIRQYAHGGFFRNVTRDLFFTWPSRSTRELIVSEKARKKGIPTPKVLAAITEIVFFPFYKSYLISEEIPNSMDALHYLKILKKSDSPSSMKDKKEVIEKAAGVIRKMHDVGIYHADLNLKNILVANLNENDKKIYLLDFDKSVVTTGLSEGQRRRNLLRLNRSVKKFNREGVLITIKDRIVFLKSYYNDNLDLRKVLRIFT